MQNVGNENAAILNFTIPAGAAGPTGATPAISVQVSGLPAGSEPTASVSGTPEAPVISLGIPAGQQGTPGTPGTNGTDGQTPNITIGTVETLPAGSDVTASITGQTPNLVLNLGIPQGPAGAGVPSTDGVPTDYLLSPAGWVAPLPWVSGMDCYEGKYYSYNGHIYRVADGGTMAPCVWEPGTAGLWQWELVE